MNGSIDGMSLVMNMNYIINPGNPLHCYANSRIWVAIIFAKCFQYSIDTIHLKINILYVYQFIESITLYEKIYRHKIGVVSILIAEYRPLNTESNWYNRTARHTRISLIHRITWIKRIISENKGLFYSMTSKGIQPCY